jgi:hypothetical protein
MERLTHEVGPNLQLGFRTFWNVFEDYEIFEGRLCYHGRATHHYAPTLHPEIPSEIAKLQRDDEEGVLKFARLYGNLGWNNLIPRERYARGGAIPLGDPLQWVWAHADTLNICQEITYRLQEGDIASLRGYLHSLRVTHPNGQVTDLGWGTGDTWAAAIVAERGEERVGQRGILNQDHLLDEDVKGLARFIRRFLINENISGIHRALFDEGTKDRLFWEFQALIEIAYWHMATSVHGRRFKHCEADDCGALFAQTDQRQRFCPPRFGQKQESRCAVRHRVHKHRQKDLR